MLVSVRDHVDANVTEESGERTYVHYRFERLYFFFLPNGSELVMQRCDSYTPSGDFVE
jgi:hypothetical protein